MNFLAIDHINKGGRKHLTQIGGTAYFYYWLRDNNYPAGFRVLCHNCNQALGLYGFCPHDRDKVIKPYGGPLPWMEVFS